ncbi:MAG: hypothetical protein EOP48_05695 [Sphingobacteriales bacterium]|nr:MAG: hypothetical protein EOP48_05695 [Sphingobacteriales bacterium]
MLFMKQWYAVYTKPNWEKKIAQALAKKKIEHFLPLSLTDKLAVEHSGRQPLFPSCLFVKLSDNQKEQILEIRGVINYLYWVETPAIFPEIDIELLKEYLHEHKAVKIEKIPVWIDSTAYLKEICIDSFNKINQLVLPCFGYALSPMNKQAKVRLVKVKLQHEHEILDQFAVV